MERLRADKLKEKEEIVSNYFIVTLIKAPNSEEIEIRGEHNKKEYICSYVIPQCVPVHMFTDAHM